jgi:hypothetical protein
MYRGRPGRADNGKGATMRRVIWIAAFVATLGCADCSSPIDSIEAGICYEKSGNLNRAVAAYERALLFEQDPRARKKLAALYRQMKMHREAEAVEAVAPAKVPGSFRALIGFDAGYDSNINISPESDRYPFIADKQETAFTRWQAATGYRHNLQEHGGWFLRANARALYQNNLSAHKYDSTYGRFSGGAGYHRDHYALFVPLVYSHLHYLERDLLQSVGIAPEARIGLTRSLATTLRARYSQRRYLQREERDRDDTCVALDGLLDWTLSRYSFFVRIGYESYTADDDLPAPYTDKSIRTLAFGGRYPFDGLFDLHAGYSYRLSDFDDSVALKADETRHDLTAALERDLFDAMRVHLRLQHVENRSDDPLTDYDKDEITVGLTYRFKETP